MDMFFPSSMTWVALHLLVVVFWNVALVIAQPGAANALLNFKHGVGNPSVLGTWRGDLCRIPWKGVECSGMHIVASLKLSDCGLTGFISPAIENLTSLVSLWLDGNSLAGPIPPGLSKLKNLTSLRLSRNNLNGEVPDSFLSIPNLEELYLEENQLSGTLPFAEVPKRMSIKVGGNTDLCSPNGISNLSTCAPSLAPALVFGPGEGMPQEQKSKHGSHVGAIAGGVAGAFVLVAISIAIVSLCLLKAKSLPSGNSDTGSSDPSAQGWAKGSGSPVQGIVAAIVGAQQAKQFAYQELDHATKGFNPINFIGKGRFGFVYKGLLQDGTIVAIKTRAGIPTHEFVNEVVNLAQLRHKNVVSLLGFCQEQEHQMLVYDYLPNGGVTSHLYDSNGDPVGKLDLKQRVFIALGAARGLEYLHRSIVHQDFKTNNVLLDENMVAKVTDFGLTRLLLTSQSAMTSSNGAGTHGFMDPALNFQQQMEQRNDVYSFGVFLLELISGREPLNRRSSAIEWNIAEWARSLSDLDELIAPGLNNNIAEDDCRRFVSLGLQCTDAAVERRPTMSQVVEELEHILDKEQGSAAVVAEGATVVTLGSELFR